MKRLVVALYILVCCTLAHSQMNINKLVPADRAVNDLFGLAADIDGDYAVFGAYKDSEDADGQNTMGGAGSAYVFQKNNTGEWVQMQKLVASNRSFGSRFGFDVAIYGQTIVIGAPYADQSPAFNSGAIYVFELENGVWSETEILQPSEFAGNDYFGTSVDMYEDHIAAGTFGDDDVFQFEGSIYMFHKNTQNEWDEIQKLTAVNPALNDEFGRRVKLDGNRLIAAVPNEDEDANEGDFMENAGAVYVFDYNQSNEEWDYETKLVAPDREAGRLFGMAADLDGNQVVVGAPFESRDAEGENHLNSAGAAYTFKKENNVWEFDQKLVASKRGLGDEFGSSVAIEGNFIVIGAEGENHDENESNYEEDSGSAYLFSNENGWVFAEKLVAPDRQEYDGFGSEINMQDGSIVFGVEFEDHDTNGNNELMSAGAGYIFEGFYTGLFQVNSATAFDISPNPVQRNTFLTINEDIQETYSYVIYSLSGKQIQQGLITPGKKQFITPNESGIYTILLTETKSKSSQIARFIVIE